MVWIMSGKFPDGLDNVWKVSGVSWRKTMKNHENQLGTMKSHENQPGTLKNHENQPGTMKNLGSTRIGEDLIYYDLIPTVMTAVMIGFMVTMFILMLIMVIGIGMMVAMCPIPQVRKCTF